MVGCGADGECVRIWCLHVWRSLTAWVCARIADSNTFDVHGAHTFSKGVWKSVYLTTVAPVAITSLVPHTFYNGSYPTAPLTDASHSPFRVSVAVHLSAPAGASVTVSATGNWSADATTSKVSEWVRAGCFASIVTRRLLWAQTVTLARGDSVVELELWAKPGVRLWWPNNMGDAVLYVRMCKPLCCIARAAPLTRGLLACVWWQVQRGGVSHPDIRWRWC